MGRRMDLCDFRQDGFMKKMNLDDSCLKTRNPVFFVRKNNIHYTSKIMPMTFKYQNNEAAKKNCLILNFVYELGKTNGMIAQIFEYEKHNSNPMKQISFHGGEL